MLLAIFSIWGVINSLPLVVHTLYIKGIQHGLCCDINVWEADKIMNLRWTASVFCILHNGTQLNSRTLALYRPAMAVFTFIFSKIFELFDTAFLIMKKKRVRFVKPKPIC